MYYYSANVSSTAYSMGYLPTKEKQVDFLTYCRNYLKKYGHRYSDETLKTYITQVSKLSKFRKKVSINGITKDFINSYEIYMKNVLGNNQNTVNKTFSFIKNMLNKAIADGLINDTKNPFKNMKIGRIAGKRDFLNKEEVKKIENLRLATNNYSIKNVCTYFLFSCYTGLRFGDIKLLTYSKIINDVIEIKQHKTGEFVRVPLNQKAKDLINWDKERGCIFNVISNQKTNAALKTIAKQTGIKKKLTFHVSRHTFATVGLSLGIPIEVISKLLGHTNIKTTQIYAKVLDSVKLKEISKFDKF